MKVREILERLEREGWMIVRQKGSHRQFKHPGRPGMRVTIAGNPGMDLPKGTLNSIYKQAGWK
jgi:predicted RNA binding protein YcfA (HicA-like mRNA interferase family)